MKGLILSVLLIAALTGSSSAFLKSLVDNFSFRDQCPIKLYNPRDSSFTGQKIYANAQTFHPLLATLSTYARDCDVKIDVKQSFAHEDSSKSPIMLRDHGSMAFRLGEAIEIRLLDRHNKVICGRRCMKKSLLRPSGPSDAQCFFRKLSHNTDLHRDTEHPAIIMKSGRPSESMMNLHDKRKQLQKQCKKFKSE